jgi:iron complex outermembrane recepter protein
VLSLDTVLQTFVVQNAAEVETKGVEVTVMLRPFEGFSVYGGMNFLDATFKNFAGAQCYPGQAVASCGVSNTFNVCGLRLPISPKFTATFQATYDFPASGEVVPYIQSDWYRRSSVNYLINGAPGANFGSVDTFGASFGAKVGDTLQVSVFCKNCTNEHIPQSIGIDPGDEFAGALSYTQVFGLDAVRSFGAWLRITIGYLHWSLLDNFEWHFGFGPKFGLAALEPETFRRLPKGSAKVLGRIAK